MNIKLILAFSLKLYFKVPAAKIIPFYAEQPDYSNYKAKFKTEYNEEPALFSDYGYDTIRLIEQAAEKAGSTDAEKIKETMYSITYNGATGTIQFDSSGERTGSSFEIYEVKEGKAVKMETFK